MPAKLLLIGLLLILAAGTSYFVVDNKNLAEELLTSQNNQEAGIHASDDASHAPDAMLQNTETHENNKNYPLGVRADNIEDTKIKSDNVCSAIDVDDTIRELFADLEFAYGFDPQKLQKLYKHQLKNATPLPRRMFDTW